MNYRKLSIQALSYLASLKQPLPCESDVEFYKQNKVNYEALYTLNKKGLARTENELNAMANAPLTKKEIKATVKKLIKNDSLVCAEYDKQDLIGETPKYWSNFYSGYEAQPTGRCSQLMANSYLRISKLSAEHSALVATITMNEAIEFGYPTDCMEDDFKQQEAA